MRRLLIAPVVLALLAPLEAFAGPDSPSQFDATPYTAPQKVIYDVNLANPSDIKAALNTVKVHIRTLKEFGNPPFKIVIVAHGNEINALSRLNKTSFPDMYNAVKEVTDLGVAIHICRGAAKIRGYNPDDFYDLVTVVPLAPADIAKLQGEGYSYINVNLLPRITHDDLKK
jgi:intracellular sulfur oxidation DsrE/DsrF family protein